MCLLEEAIILQCDIHLLKLQADIDAVFKWCKERLLSLSLDKLSYLHMIHRFTDYVYVYNVFEINDNNNNNNNKSLYTLNRQIKSMKDVNIPVQEH